MPHIQGQIAHPPFIPPLPPGAPPPPIDVGFNQFLQWLLIGGCVLGLLPVLYAVFCTGMRERLWAAMPEQWRSAIREERADADEKRRKAQAPTIVKNSDDYRL